MNELDPLSQLRDIHLPEPVGIWPLAPGWWVLMLLAIVLVGALVWWLIKRAQQQQYRKTASSLLEQAWATYSQNDDSSVYLTSLITLLRRTAITAYPKANVKQLHGQQWLVFLDSTISSTDGKQQNPFTHGCGKMLLTMPYRPASTHDKNAITALHQLTDYWINNHVALKKHSPKTPGNLGEVAHA